MSTILSPTALTCSSQICLQPATIAEIMCKVEDQRKWTYGETESH